MANEARQVREACGREINRIQPEESRCLVVADLDSRRGAVVLQNAVGTVSMGFLSFSCRQVEARDADRDPTGDVCPPHAGLEGRDLSHAFLVRHSHEFMALSVDLNRLGSGARWILPRQNQQRRSKTSDDRGSLHGALVSRDDDSFRTSSLLTMGYYRASSRAARFPCGAASRAPGRCAALSNAA